MVSPRQKRGAAAYRRGVWAEVLCTFYLMVRGYKILARRYVTRAGEIDLIVQKDQEVIFIEVKARPTMDQAAEAISQQQQVRLKHAAALYLSGRSSLSHCAQRFDAMLVVPWKMPVHYENAF